MQRRNFFKKSILTGWAVAGAAPLLSAFHSQAERAFPLRNVKPQMAAPRGAIYIPARAFNTWQQWKHYDQEEIERDFGYAASLRLNALRVWMSYDYWVENPKRHEKCLE